MLSVEDWAEIRRLHRAEGLPIKAVARVLGISKNTVKAALASEEPPKYQRQPKGSIVDELEPRIRELLQAGGVGAWGEILGDTTVAAAMLDRLLHRSVVINLDGDSYRLTRPPGRR